MLENEKADSGRKVALLAAGINFGDEAREVDAARPRDLFEAAPESVFQANAGFMFADGNRALYDG